MKEPIRRLRDMGYCVFDVDDEEVPIQARIGIETVEDLYRLHEDLEEDLIISTNFGEPEIEIYNYWRE